MTALEIRPQLVLLLLPVARLFTKTKLSEPEHLTLNSVKNEASAASFGTDPAAEGPYSLHNDYRPYMGLYRHDVGVYHIKKGTM